MGSRKKCNVPADKLELYDKVVAKHGKVERKGAANPYTSLNGHMFSYMNQAGSLALRLSAEDREAFLKKYKTGLFEMYGMIMKEYVTVPDKLLHNTKELMKHFDASYRYVGTLRPKPTKKH